MCAHLPNTLRFLRTENRFTTKRASFTPIGLRRTTHSHTPFLPIQKKKSRAIMQNNSSNDPPVDIDTILNNFDAFIYSYEEPGEDDVINENLKAFVDEFTAQRFNPSSENLALIFPMISCTMANRLINKTDLKLTKFRKAILMDAFTPFIPPGEKYDLIRRAHYQAMLKVFRIERAPDFETKPLAEQRAIVKRFVDHERVNQLFCVKTKIDLLQVLEIMKEDEIHPEIVAVAAEWSDD